MPVKKYGALTSSVDPTQLSLSVTSAANIAIGLIGTLAAYKGLDSGAITSQLQAFVALTVTLIPVAFTTWHTLQLMYGLVRKLLVAFSTTAPAQQ
jgi:hypothetical protein